mgnify:CR=1 FL=1|jgi:hypothetical protein
MKQFYPYCLILLVLAAAGTKGQSVTPVTAFNSAGGTWYGNGYHRFEWSFGEAVLVNTLTPQDNSVYITQGVLQPITEQSSLSPYIVFFAKGEYFIFPNPTQGLFEVNFMVRQSGRLELQLTDHMGKVLQKKALRYNGWGHIEKFDLTNYPNGTYLVIATLTPDTPRPGDSKMVIRHSGFKIVKIK